MAAEARAPGRLGARTRGVEALRRLAALTPQLRQLSVVPGLRSIAVLTWVGAALTVSGLLLVPMPFGTVHALLLSGMATLLAAAQFGAAAAAAPTPANASRERFGELCDTLERRLEKMQDVHWEISESDVRYRDLLDAQSDIILRRDHQHRLTFVNDAFVKTFGMPAEDAIGHVFDRKVVDGEGVAPLATTDMERRRSYMECLETTAGPRWIAWEESLVSAGDGASFEVQAVGRDVTEERRRSAELAEARDQAEAANRAKSRFLAAMSHEIRTPMNGILGMAALMTETGLSEEQRTYASAIDQSAHALLALIDEILDFSKIEAGKLVLNDAPFSLAMAAQSVVELLSPRAHEKGLELALSIDSDLQGLWLGDEARVRQILLNLVSNAVKFTDTGGVAVTIGSQRRDSDGLGRRCIRILVEDSGIGLSTDDMHRLFTEFEQADAAVRRQQGGTGLGLAISRRLAIAMGGDIEVSSTPGHGSSFAVSLILEPVPTHALPEPREEDLDGPRHNVLLAFDHRIERGSVARMLRAAGHNVIEADTANAQKAIDVAAARNAPVDRLIVDATADPQIGGQLLASARRHSAEPVIGIVTVNVLARAGLAAFRLQGFERYLVRPVRSSSLLQQIATGEARRAPGGPAGGSMAARAYAHQAAGARAVRVLLVEDNEINALLARRVLERSGCIIEHRSDGAAGVARVVAGLNTEEPAIDLVLMDIFMPVLDGVAAARQIREAHEHLENSGADVGPRPAIVALTANAFPEDRERYLSEGLDDYLAKPFDTRDLEALLDRWVLSSDQPSIGGMGSRRTVTASLC